MGIHHDSIVCFTTDIWKVHWNRGKHTTPVGTLGQVDFKVLRNKGPACVRVQGVGK